MKITTLLFTLFLFFIVNAKSIARADSLYINGGDISFLTLGLNPFPFLAFNESGTFDKSNDFIEINRNEVLDLTIINNDSIVHTVHINQGQHSTGKIQANSSVTLSLTFNTNGLYEIRDSTERGLFLGLSTFIKVWDSTAHNFFWNLNELESDLNRKIGQGLPFDSDTFNPDYFTINGNTHPQISSDSSAKVTGNVGDSIYIFVFNSGKMYHAVHFHGYHVAIISSSSDARDVGRVKDSIPIKPNSYQVYLLVPNQPGQFPVHDHNLIATTGGGNYPNGMMVMMNISP